jgi:O-antigen/teichoic acid export membrane protein
MFKLLAITVFLLILISLGTALFHLVTHKEGETSDKTAKALTVRISLSLLLFIIIFISVASGLLEPHGIGTRMHQKNTAQPVSNPEK